MNQSSRRFSTVARSVVVSKILAFGHEPMSSWDRYERASQLRRGEDFGGPIEGEGDRVKEGS